MHYLFELRDNGVWSADEILYELSNRRFDTALISVYSPYVGGHSKQARTEELRDAPKLTEKILRVSNLIYDLGTSLYRLLMSRRLRFASRQLPEGFGNAALY